MNDVVAQIVTWLLGGAGIAGASSLLTSRAIARKTDAEREALQAKAPAEVDSVVVQGAETAVITMQTALTSAMTRIEQLEAERAADRRTISELQTQVASLREQSAAAETAAAEAKRVSEQLQQRIDGMARRHDARD